MNPIKITPSHSRFLEAALSSTQEGLSECRLSTNRLFAYAAEFEMQFQLYRLAKAHRVGAVGVIYGSGRTRSYACLPDQTCVHAVLERRRSGWFLIELEKVRAMSGHHLRLTLDQAERIIERSDPGRVVLRAFDELRATVEWHPRTDEMYRETLRSIAALAASNPTVYSGLLNLAREDTGAIVGFFRAVSQAAAKGKVLADRDARKAAQLSSVAA